MIFVQNFLGLLLALFGGSNPNRSGDQSVSDRNRLTRRPDIHVLVVGDPGLGKSQMLRACTAAAPRGKNLLIYLI